MQYVYYYVRTAQVAHEYVAHVGGDSIVVRAWNTRHKSWIRRSKPDSHDPSSMDWHGCRLRESFILCLHRILSHERDFCVCTQERRRSHAQLRGAVETEQDRIGSNRKRRRASRASTDGPRATGKRSRVVKCARSASPSKSDVEFSATEKESEQEQEDTLANGSQEESDADEDGSGEQPESED